MRKRVPDEVLEEIISNDGCRKGSANPINATGVLRLALDLQEARAEASRMSALLSTSANVLRSAAKEIDRLQGGG